MKISYNWLHNYIETGLPAEQLANLLTNCGLEVEGIETFQSVKGGFEGLVIGEVITCKPHPNADKLSLTTVDIGTGTLLQIVCGAPNVAAGQKVVVATIGAKLFPTDGELFEIKKSKIRGELSEGMICAEDEIGLGASHAGIIVLPNEVKSGIPAKVYFNIEEDRVFEIGLTPNRADAASHIGVARDVAAVLQNMEAASNASGRKPVIVYPSLEQFKVDNQELNIDVEVKDPLACPRYSGITVSGVKVSESPQWLKNRLLSIGVNPINNIVDITNFVLHECGQPLHAFDAAQIQGKKVIVRTAGAGEKFITLDNIERKLSATDLMICDASKPMCIAGVFGGIASGVTNNTTSVFIESACFNPASIRKTSRHHGLKTDASFRFERGTDPEITIYALKRAALLIKEIAGGKISSEIVDIYPEKIAEKNVEYQFRRATSLIGKAISKDELKSILTSLNFGIIKETEDALLLSIPTYKVDVTREADVVEEVLRIYGYDKIDVPSKLSAAIMQFPKNDPDELQEKISGYLSGNGFYEMLNNTLTSLQHAEPSSNPETDAIKLINPLSQELNALRQSMLFSGLETISYNKNRQHNNLRVYEFGTTYRNSGKGYLEELHLALFVSGKKNEESWNSKNSDAGFFYLKSIAENVLTLAGIDLSKLKEEAAGPTFSYGVTWSLNGKEIGSLGMASLKLARQFDLKEVYYADFHWTAIAKYSTYGQVRFAEIPRFPQVKRDLSMVLNVDVSYRQLRDIAFRTERNLLKEINLFDVYSGDKIEAGKKSYALSFTLLDERQTLTDKTIDKVMNRLMEAFEKEAGAVIRKGAA